MHLADILNRRTAPGAAISLGITRRCPLSCAHCATSSTLASDESATEKLLAFVRTMTEQSRPDFLLMSGGEALLRPQLVRRIADHARRIGARSQVLSGLFFANGPRIPRPVKAAIDAVDHFSASFDAYHEREVPRAAAFKVLRQLLDEGKDVSMQLVGLGPDDRYLADLVGEVRSTFEDRIPMFVAPVVPHGRARSWVESGPEPHFPGQALPCTVAGWPVVGFDGRVTTCGNQDVMDGKVPMPDHLLLGDIAVDDWAAIKERCLASSTLRVLRALGPLYLSQRAGARSCSGYCETCWALSEKPDLPAMLDGDAQKNLAIEAVAQQILADAGPVAFARQWGIAEYADLVMLGLPKQRNAQWNV
ncbi:radical SAM protein [Kitasatospora sp. NPDC101235]|uniref:radical SAM protein n=1 Tax=Kitasatospora sp. NPDC101235 TaxID=3364101 RepID=UPI00382C4363